MADFSRDPREHWLKPRFSKNEVANSGYNKNRVSVFIEDLYTSKRRAAQSQTASSGDRAARHARRDWPSTDLKKTRSCADDFQPQRTAIDSSGTPGRARSSFTRSNRTCRISSWTERPVSSRKRNSASRREQPSSAKTSRGFSPSQARSRTISTAFETAALARGSRRVDWRRTTSSAAKNRCASSVNGPATGTRAPRRARATSSRG